MFLSQQVKRNVLIANKNVKYELNDELPKDARLGKILKLHVIIVSSLIAKMKILPILARNYEKLDIELSP